MKRISQLYKWHYYNNIDEACNTKGFGKTDKSTLCGLRFKLHHNLHHTEFKSRVTCRRCLQKIIRYDKLLTKGETL